ncbi:hypothetical protein O1W69_00350 [Chlamydia sp. 12-01]|uniref:hypothetical protein n=1 Tax=Chlamydia sp. 12-01 TaxID=3002742 RepID=UPI0035D407CB
MSISPTSVQNSKCQEPLNLFSKGSEARNKLIHFIAHCVVQVVVLTVLTAGIIALGSCMHPMFFIFLLAVIPVYLSLRHLATDKLREVYITFSVYPTEDNIHNIVYF